MTNLSGSRPAWSVTNLLDGPVTCAVHKLPDGPMACAVDESSCPDRAWSVTSLLGFACAHSLLGAAQRDVVVDQYIGELRVLYKPCHVAYGELADRSEDR